MVDPMLFGGQIKDILQGIGTAPNEPEPAAKP
jgi:hypothetical protein